ncbi:MAG: amidohydrolase [Alphaproteobacteria bacterium]
MMGLGKCSLPVLAGALGLLQGVAAPAFAQSDAAIDVYLNSRDGMGQAHQVDDGHNHGLQPVLVQTVIEAAANQSEPEAAPPKTDTGPAFPSTYTPYPGETVLITNATVLTGTGERLEKASVLIEGRRIAAVGTGLSVAETVQEIDGSGKWVTPGIIDIHSHLGVYPSPGVRAHSDGNEATSPNTAFVWAEHSVWPQDPGFTRALAGGITSLHILPGSANLFGGRGVTLKNVSSRTVQGMKFPGAPYTLKMACGENPKRVYGSRGRSPATRMGNIAKIREAWIAATDYKASWDTYEAKIAKGEEAKAPKRNLTNETLKGVLDGDILVQMHCYRQDEMAIMLDVAREFDYQITAFHHAVEAYKIADLLKEAGTCSAVWADWWGFKMEAYDGVRENGALIHAAGACAIIHSDSDVGIQRLNQEAAKTMADGNRIGLGITRAQAIAWITANPAKALGIFEETGSLETGKAGDVVVWSGDPFSVYAQAEQVFIDGALLYDRNDPALSPRTDFEIGQIDNTMTGGAGQ